MAFLTGIGSSLQIGKESTFAQGAIPTALVDISSESIKVGVEKGDEATLLGSKTPANRDLLSVSVEGSLSFVLRPEFAGLLLHAALGGTDVCTRIEDTDFYTHTLTLANVGALLPSLTVIVDRKAAVKRYTGCTISSLSLECAAGDYVKGSIDLKGTKEETGSLNTSLKGFLIPSYRCNSATFSFADEEWDISSATLKVDNALEAAPRTYASGLYASQPQSGKRNVSLSFEIPYSSKVESLKNEYLLSENTAEITLAFTSSNSDYTITVVCPNVSVGEVDATIGGTGILSSSISAEALSVGDEEPLTIIIVDKNATPYGGQ